MTAPKKNTPTNRTRSVHHPIARPSTSIHQHVGQIAEAVDETWHNAHGHSDLEIPVSAVAALALLTPLPAQRDTIAAELINANREQFTEVIRAQWALFVRARPDLSNRAWPLIRPWHSERPLDDLALRAAQRVATSALGKGLWHLTTETKLRYSTDLLGETLTTLRGRKAAEAHGKFYTPASLTTTMANLLGVPEEGQAVHESAAGTGGMLRAMAQ